jgi:hypothetical protein
METIYLESRLVPATLRGSYRGNKFKARICESMTVPSNAGLWSDGSRNVFYAVRMADGVDVALSDQMAAPWDTSRRDKAIAITPGIVVVCHSMFCGKDRGLTFYLHPLDAAPLLAAPVELNDVERHVLASRGYKSSYMGKDRYQMQRDSVRWSRDPSPFPTRVEWNAAEEDLKCRGYLTKAGAITPAGRNAARAA